jgi:hypothetical protein
MSLIKLKDIGFGLKGNTLDLIIAVPKDCYLNKFRVFNQNDLTDEDCFTLGTDYIDDLVRLGHSYKQAFHILFGDKPVSQYIDEVTQEEYDVYSFSNGEYAHAIKPSQEDMTIIAMELFYPDAESCCDTKLTVPLYNPLTMKLKALDFAGTIDGCNCEVPKEFIDKLLQIKAIELALCCKDYCAAAKYWKMFYDKKVISATKKCGCHG